MIEQWQSIAAKHSCPVCQAEPAKRVWTTTSFGNSGFKLSAPKRLLSGAPVSPLVCTVCGYVQFFVNPKEYRD